MDIRIDSVYSLNVKSASESAKIKSRSRLLSALESKHYDSLVDRYCIVALEQIDIGKRKHISYSKWMKSHSHCNSRCFKKKGGKILCGNLRYSSDGNVTIENRITRSCNKSVRDIQSDSDVTEPPFKRRKVENGNENLQIKLISRDNTETPISLLDHGFTSSKRKPVSFETKTFKSTQKNIKIEPEDQLFDKNEPSTTKPPSNRQKDISIDQDVRHVRVKEEPSLGKSAFEEICKVIARAPKDKKASYIAKLNSILGNEGIMVKQTTVSEIDETETTPQENDPTCSLSLNPGGAFAVSGSVAGFKPLASPVDIVVPKQSKTIIATTLKSPEHAMTKTDASESKTVAAFQTYMDNGKLYIVQKHTVTVSKQEVPVLQNSKTGVTVNSSALQSRFQTSDVVLKYGSIDAINDPTGKLINPTVRSPSPKKEIHGHLVTHPDGKQYFLPLADGQTFPSKPTLHIDPDRIEKNCQANIFTNNAAGVMSQANMIAPVISSTSTRPRNNLSIPGTFPKAPGKSNLLQKGTAWVPPQKILCNLAPNPNATFPKATVKVTESAKHRHAVQATRMPNDFENKKKTSSTGPQSSVTSSKGISGVTPSSTDINHKQVTVPLLMNGVVQNVLLNVLPNGNFSIPTTNSAASLSEIPNPMLVNQGIVPTENVKHVPAEQVRNTPANSVKAGEIVSSTINNVQPARVANAPINNVQVGQISNTSGNNVQAGQVLSAPAKHVQTRQISNDPVNKLQTGQVSHGPSINIQPGQHVFNPLTNSVQTGQVINTSINNVQAGQALNIPTGIIQPGQILNTPLQNIQMGPAFNTGFQMPNLQNNIISLQNQVPIQLGGLNFPILQAGPSQIQIGSTGQVLNMNPVLGQMPITNVNSSSQVLQPGPILSGGINPLLQVGPILNPMGSASQGNIIGNAQSQNPSHVLLNGQLIPINLLNGQMQTINGIGINSVQQNHVSQIVSGAPSTVVATKGIQIKSEIGTDLPLLNSNSNKIPVQPVSLNVSSTHVVTTPLPSKASKSPLSQQQTIEGIQTLNSTRLPGTTKHDYTTNKKQHGLNSVKVVTTASAPSVIQNHANQSIDKSDKVEDSSTSVTSVLNRPLSHTQITQPSILSKNRRSYSPSHFYNVTKSKIYKDQIEENVTDLKQKSKNTAVPMFLKTSTGQILPFSAVKPNSEPNHKPNSEPNHENAGNLVASLLTTNSGGQAFSRSLASPLPSTNSSSQNPTRSNKLSQQSVPRFVPAQGYLKTSSPSSSNQGITKAHPILQKSLQTVDHNKLMSLNEQSKRNKRKPDFVVRIDQDSKSCSKVEYIEIEDEDNSPDEDYSIFNVLSSRSNTNESLPMALNASHKLSSSAKGHDNSTSTKPTVSAPRVVDVNRPLMSSMETSSKSIVEKGLRIPDSMIKDLEKKQLSVESTVQKLKLYKQVL